MDLYTFPSQERIWPEWRNISLQHLVLVDRVSGIVRGPHRKVGFCIVRGGTCRGRGAERKGVILLATVSLRPGESQESLLKRFRKEVMKERILPTVRKKRWFTPPSELRRLKKQKAIRKARQAQRRREGRESMR
jgi:small subunit ribosomal protein S21